MASIRLIHSCWRNILCVCVNCFAILRENNVTTWAQRRVKMKWKAENETKFNSMEICIQISFSPEMENQKMELNWIEWSVSYSLRFFCLSFAYAISLRLFYLILSHDNFRFYISLRENSHSCCLNINWLRVYVAPNDTAIEMACVWSLCVYRSIFDEMKWTTWAVGINNSYTASVCANTLLDFNSLDIYKCFGAFVVRMSMKQFTFYWCLVCEVCMLSGSYSRRKTQSTALSLSHNYTGLMVSRHSHNFPSKEMVWFECVCMAWHLLGLAHSLAHTKNQKSNKPTSGHRDDFAVSQITKLKAIQVRYHSKMH